MQKIVFVITFLFSNLSYTQNLNTITDLPKASMQPQVQDPLCKDCESIENLYKACYQASCPVFNLMTERLRLINFAKIDKEMKEIEELYGKAFEREIANMMEDLKDYLDLLKSDNRITDRKLFLEAMQFKAIFGNLDLENAEEIIGLKNNNLLKNLAKYIENYVKNRQEYQDAINIGNLEILYNNYFAQEDVGAVYESQWQEFEKIKSKLMEIPYFKRFSDSDRVKNVVKDALDRIKVNNPDKKDVIRLRTLRLVFEKKLEGTKNPEFINPTEQFSLEDLNKIFYNQELIKKIEDIKAQLNQAKKNKQIKSKVYGACLDNIRESYAALPTQKQIDDYAEKFEEYKKKFKNNIFKKLSSHSVSIIEPHFDSTKPAFPDSREKFLRQTKTKLNISSEENVSTNPDPVRVHSLPLDLITKMNSFKDGPLTYIKKETNFNCEKIGFSMINDFANSVFYAVNTGWGSIQFPQYGEQIAYHELAHIFSGLVSYYENSARNTLPISEKTREIYKQTKLCLAQMQKKPNELENYFLSGGYSQGNAPQASSLTFKSSRFTEEDFSDLLAAELSDPDHPPLWCFEWPEKYDVKRSNPYAHEKEKYHKHSSGIFRDLHKLKVQGKLNPSCEKFLEKAAPDLKLKDCWE